MIKTRDELISEVSRLENLLNDLKKSIIMIKRLESDYETIMAEEDILKILKIQHVPFATKKSIKYIIDTNRLYRYKHVTGDIYILKYDISIKNKQMPYQTAVKDHAGSIKRSVFIEKFNLPKTNEVVREIMNISYKGLFGGKIFVAGGSVCCTLIGEQNRFSDYDLFMVGFNNENKKFALDSMIKIAETHGYSVLYTKKTLTFVESNKYGSQLDPGINYSEIKNYTRSKHPSTNRALNIQIILKDYFSFSEVLHSFDVYSCCVGFDGLDIYVTTASLFALTYMTNILDPMLRSPSHDYRLFKYYMRGFSLMLPGLNTNIIIFDNNNSDIFTVGRLEFRKRASDIILNSLAKSKNEDGNKHSGYSDKEINAFSATIINLKRIYFIDDTSIDSAPILIHNVANDDWSPFISSESVIGRLNRIHNFKSLYQIKILPNLSKIMIRAMKLQKIYLKNVKLS